MCVLVGVIGVELVDECGEVECMKLCCECFG